MKFGIASKEIEEEKRKERALKFGLNNKVVVRGGDNGLKEQRAIRFN